MKILHTADWHIGKKLHKTELSEDFDLFIDWLCELLEKEQVELLLISGDVFDLANPSSEARKQYYRALIKLKRFDCKIILTGGNHDSPAMLDAPKEVLRELDIHIIGGLPESMEEVVIPVFGKEGQPELLVAALPFLRDSDLRSANDGITYEDRLEATRKGIQNCFIGAADLCRKEYPGIPVVAMGHLFAAGIETSESERDIQLGNQAAFEASRFGDHFSYIALGHIHKPQRVSAAVPAFYSGSPLPLSFSERKDEKRVLLIDTQTGWEPRSINIPSFRKLLKVSGNLEELRQKLQELSEEKELESLIEVELLEEQYDAVKLYDLDELVSNFNKPGYRIVKHRATFQKQRKGASEAYETGVALQDLKPKDVFLELIANHEYEEETRQEILSAFDEIMEEVNQDEKL
ncbi:Exodeoxyribonuclease I subunit D [Salinimicrobium catena]|uniref:Nuclease SbcCD subunit D n=1 Tax=Salinimicrobium catena TaxID=390640 RepID=A0A1H5N0X9_9FLAO|nr:exonuclease SbcCD subunit D C-terminal domain-containing protein [Salinimicrobium catena]SDL34144.1 Exodeoxyribonuclease I subunit D [Salinimicrobium catena]SEE95213.1 Exodeoxyribonuclease I subunit D [Salinimicrobium catena]